MAYVVCVDDNFHFMDESERYKLGEFDTSEAAEAAWREIVDEFLLQNHKPGCSSEDLYVMYTMFGEDPFIIGEPACSFSAWNYAKQRAEEICRAPAHKPEPGQSS